jgi:hypothetical protein
MDAQKKVLELLGDLGAQLVRNRRHTNWLLPNGELWTTPKTASDYRSWLNNYADLKRKVFGVDSQPKTYESKTEKTHTRKSDTPDQFIRYEPAEVIIPTFREKVRIAMYGPPPAPPKPTPKTKAEVYTPPRHYNKKERIHHGEVHTYSKEQIELLNRVRADQGEAAMQLVLATLHDTQFSIVPVNLTHTKIQPMEDDIVDINFLKKRIEDWKQKAEQFKLLIATT